MLNKLREVFYNHIGMHFDGAFWYKLACEAMSDYEKLDSQYYVLEDSYAELEADFKSLDTDYLELKHEFNMLLKSKQ